MLVARLLVARLAEASLPIGRLPIALIPIPLIPITRVPIQIPTPIPLGPVLIHGGIEPSLGLVAALALRLRPTAPGALARPGIAGGTAPVVPVVVVGEQLILQRPQRVLESLQGALVGLALTEQATVQTEHRLLQLAHRQVEFTGIAVAPLLQGQQILHIAQGHLHGPLLALSPIGAQLEAGIAQPALRLGHQGERPVAAIDLNPLAPVLGRLLLGLLDQAGDLLLAEVGAPLDAHALLATGGAVHGRNLQQAVGIDVERHLHLGHPAGSRGNAGKAKAAEALVVARHLPLALQRVHLHGALVGRGGAEHITAPHGNGGVARNQHLHHATDRLQPQGEGRDVVKHQVAQLAGEDSGLDGGADRHHFIGVHRLAGIPGHQGAHHLLHHWHAGAAAHQHHVVDVVSGQAAIPQGALHRPQQPVEQIRAEALKGAPLEGGFDVQRPLAAGGDEGQGDGRALHPAQLDLGLLGRLGEALQGLAIAAQVEAMLLLEGIGQPVHDAAVPVVAAQLGVAAGGLHVKHALGDAQDRHVERAAAQVEHQHPLGCTAVEAVGQGRRRGFVENALHADSRQAAGIAGGLALGIIEVGRHRDHRRIHGLAEVGGCVVAELAQDAGHQLFGGVLPLRHGTDNTHVALVIGAHGVRHREAAVVELVPLAPHEALEVGEGVAGVQHQLPAGELAHQQLLVTAVAHHRGGGAGSLRTGDHLGPAALKHRHHGIGCAEVDSDDAPHVQLWSREPRGGPKLPVYWTLIGT